MQRSSREQVLDAVVASVQDLGVRRTTMAEVARRAGVSRSTLYTHFPDVTAATAAALTRELVALVEVVLAEIDPAAASGSGRQRLIAAAVELAARVPEQPLIARVLELDAELLVPYLVHQLGSSQRAIVALVAELVAAGQQEGSIRPGPPRELAVAVFLTVQSFTVSARIVRDELGADRAARLLTDLLEGLLRPGSEVA